MSSFQVRVLQNTAQVKENLPQLRKNAHSLYFHIIITVLDLNTFFSSLGIYFTAVDLTSSHYYIYCFFFLFLVQWTQFHASYCMHLTSIKRSKRIRKCFPNAGRSWINLKTSSFKWTAAADEIPVLRNFWFRSQCQANLL